MTKCQPKGSQNKFAILKVDLTLLLIQNNKFNNINIFQDYCKKRCGLRGEIYKEYGLYL